MLSIGLRAIRWRTVPLVHAAPLVAATRMLATRPKSKPMTKPQPKQAAMGPQTGEDASMLKLASLRLICDQGKVLGVMPPQQAHDEAAARGLFLLEVQGSTDPPVWRLVATLPSRAAAEDKPGGEPAPSRGVPGRQGRGSVGQQPTKRPTNKEARIKEVRLVDKSADHDVDTKMNFARGQLEKGRIVQVYILGTGRLEPGSTTSRAATIMARLGDGVADLASVTAVQGAKRPQGKGIGGPGGSLICATFTPLGYKPPAPGQRRTSVGTR